MTRNWLSYFSMSALALGLWTCDYIHDDSLQPCEYRLHFVYDYNMKFADAFQKEVSQVSLFLCDDKGNFITKRQIEGDELKANNVLLDVEPGTYYAVTWAGLSDVSYELPQLTPGESTIEDIKVRTLRNSDATQPNELTPLWHSLDTLIVTGKAHEEKEISLAKNTNRLRFILQDTEGYSMNVKDFTFEITADNGYMDYDNSLIEDPLITYTPYFTDNVNIASEDPDIAIGDTLKQYVAVAEMNTMRLMNGENYRLIVRHKDWKEDVLNINLPSYLLLTKMEGHNISAQEYLDRQDEYSIIFFLTPILCPDCPDPEEPEEPEEPEDPEEPEEPEPPYPIVGYACYKIQVKDWVIRINNGEL